MLDFETIWSNYEDMWVWLQNFQISFSTRSTWHEWPYLHFGAYIKRDNCFTLGQISIFTYHQDSKTENMTCSKFRYLLSNYMSRLFSPGSSRETDLFGGPDPNRRSMHESAKGAKPLTVKEQPAFSAPPGSGLFAKDSIPIRLHVSFPFLRVNTEL